MIKNKWHGDEFPVYTDRVGVFSQTLNDADKTYHDLLEQILEEGIWKENRTGTKTISIFGPQVVFSNVGEKFPLLTTKKVHLKSIIGELLWFLEGSTDKNRLKDHYGVSIWDEWDAPNPKFDGDMGPIYGNQWVNWNGEDINQIQNVIDTLKKNPDDRRMIVSAWNPSKLQEMALPPCHWSYQFETRQYPGEEKRRVNLKMNIRSWDIFLGGPFNIASYAILLLMIAQEVDMIPGDLIISAGDVHIYEDHLPFVYRQLERNSKGNEPIMKLNPNKSFWDFTPEDFKLLLYDPHPNFRNVPIAV